MTRNTVFLLGGVFAGLLAFVGFGGQEASAFTPTQEELKVINEVSKLRAQLENADPSDKDFWKIMDKYDKAVDVLNYMGIYVEDQEPDLDHITGNYTNTRQFAQAVKNGTVATPSPAVASGQTCTTSCNTKSIYLKSGFKDPYLTVLGHSLYNHYVSGKSSPVLTGGSDSMTFTPNWSNLKSGILPTCVVGSDTRPATATYTAGISVTASDGTRLIPYDSQTKSDTFNLFHGKSTLEFAKQNNVASGPTITCTLINVTVN